MISKKSINLIGKYIKFCNTFNGTPFEWDKNSKSAIVSKSKFHQRCFQFAALQNFLYLLYLLVRFCTYGTEDENIKNKFITKTWLFIWINFYIWASISFYNTYVKKQELVTYFRCIKQLYLDYKVTCGYKLKPFIGNLNVLQLSFISMAWIVVLITSASTLLFIAIPTKLQYPYSLVNQDIVGSKSLNLILFVIFVAFEFYSKASFIFIMAMDCVSILLTILPSMVCLRLIRESKLNVKQRIEDYTKFQLLFRLFNKSAIWLLRPIIFLWVPTSFATISMFGSIRYYNLVSIFEYMPFPVLVQNCLIGMAILIAPATEIHLESRKIYQQLRSIKMTKRQRMQVQSLRPIGVKLGMIPFIRKIGLLKTYDVFANWVVTLLVTYPQEIFI